MAGKVYVDEDGNKKMDIRLWDAKQYITEIRKLHNSVLKFYAATRDGVRYVVVEECRTLYPNKQLRPKTCLAVPLYVPINEGTEIIKPFISFIKAFQETVEAHKDVPLYDPETAAVKTKIVYTNKELREQREAAENDVSKV